MTTLLPLQALYQRWQIKQAARCLAQGGIIAYPTEAVYGLGCDPYSELAVARLLQLKNRPQSKGLILLTHALEQARPLLKTLPLARQQEILATWPGPVTWLLPISENIPVWIHGNHATVAVRVTAHPLAAALCQHWNNWLVSTSANQTEQPPARSAQAIKQIFPHGLDYIIQGKTGHLNKPTEIRDALTGQIIRKG